MLTHEERLQRAILFNQERVSNRKAGQIATRNMIKENQLSDEEMAELVGIYPRWKVGIDYKVGDLLAFHGALYEVIQAHTSQSDWKPDTAESLFKSHAPAGVIPEWEQPAGGHDAYNIGDKVTFNGNTYESTIDANTWSPADYPEGWKEI